MRLAVQSPSSKAVQTADSTLAKSNFTAALCAEIEAKAAMSCHFGAARSQWFDEYVKAGGKFIEICNERVAPLKPDPVVAQVADHIFHNRHPERRSKPISLSNDDRQLRSEWMDLYVEYGGRVAELCANEICE